MTATANRTHKDSMFRDLFGSPERKGNALELYNALAGTDYTDPGELELTTLDDVIYMNVKNDVSFVVGDEMVLFEHQSTRNPNMPLRGLAYFARLYTARAERMGANLYGSRLIKLPTPRYVVLYSGARELPDREVVRLSDAFDGPNPAVEVVCEVVNINAGHNPEVAKACPALAGYARFVELVRMYNDGGQMSLADAVAAAIEQCVEEGHLADYLKEKRAEVFDMFLTEYDAERQRELDRQEGIEQGIDIALSRLVELGAITPEQAAEQKRELAATHEPPQTA
ncbi:MAG: hypothetical protein IJ111_14930 [Eggerthellaceae bacterium]|nr:hypothetical protein [Eggerthellaceae bacterium]